MAHVRQADLEDCVRANAVLAEFGMGASRVPERVPVWWDWIWTRNPARMPGRHHPPPGWVLEVDGEIRGFFGNIPTRFRWGDDVLVGSIASHWAVLAPYREHTRKLRDAWFGQTEPELLMVSTGVAATGRIFLRHGAASMPDESYDDVLYWVLDPSRFLRSALKKKRVPAGIAAPAGSLLGPVLDVATRLAGRRPGAHRAGLEPEEIRLDQIGDEFDDLFERRVAMERRLFASRRAEDLRWHFEPRPEAVSVLVVRRSGQLAGYLLMLEEQVPDVDLCRLKVVDWLVQDDDAEILDALLAAAWERGRERGGHVLEVVGFPERLRRRALSARPFRRRYPVHPYFYKARESDLHRALADPRHWYPCLFDGDGCLASI